jgi:hypothetical protein
MEKSYDQLIDYLNENTIDSFLELWIEKVGNVNDEEKFISLSSMLSETELLEARTQLIIRGKTISDFEVFILSHLKSYAFIGKLFIPKKYDRALKKDGLEIGYPIFYNWCKDHKFCHPPFKTGIYHLFYKGVLVYIGYSKNINKRLKNHDSDTEKCFDAVLWFVDENLKIREWLDMERNMIKYWRPSLNVNHL